MSNRTKRHIWTARQVDLLRQLYPSTVRLDGGKVCEQSRRLLDEKYNLDA